MRNLTALSLVAVLAPAVAGDSPAGVQASRHKGCNLAGNAKLMIPASEVPKPCAFFVGRPIMELNTNVSIETGCRVKVQVSKLQVPAECDPIDRMEDRDKFRIDSWDEDQFEVTYRGRQTGNKTELQKVPLTPITDGGKTYGYRADDPTHPTHRWFFYVAYLPMADGVHFEKYYFVDLVDEDDDDCWAKHAMNAENIEAVQESACPTAPWSPATGFERADQVRMFEGETGGGSEPPPK